MIRYRGMELGQRYLHSEAFFSTSLRLAFPDRLVMFTQSCEGSLNSEYYDTIPTAMSLFFASFCLCEGVVLC